MNHLDRGKCTLSDHSAHPQRRRGRPGIWPRYQRSSHWREGWKYILLIEILGRAMHINTN